MFLDEMPGIEYLQYDDYPVYTMGMDADFLPCLQIAQKVCKERGIRLNVVAQTFVMRGKGPNGNIYWRQVGEGDARWMNNALLGMGVENIHYFTYWTKSDNSTTGEYFEDGGSFITRAGKKTDLYYFMRKIMKENEKFAPVIKSFDYQTCATYKGATITQSTEQANYIQQGTFAKVQNVHVDLESALVTELFDKGNGRYMYMVQNLVNPSYNTAMQTAKLTFNENYQYAVVWKNGESQVVSLVDNQYKVTQHPGQAVYVIPFNA
jgi:hypothetical protein